MANVLKPSGKNRCALGRQCWSLRRIQRETGVNRASVKYYLRETSIAHRAPRDGRLPETPEQNQPVRRPPTLGVPPSRTH